VNIKVCRACLTSIFLLFSGTVPPFSFPQDAAPNTVWFVVSESQKGHLSVDPLLTMRSGKPLTISSGCDPEDLEYKRFVASYLRAGTEYKVRFGGAAAGAVVLKPSSDLFGNTEVSYRGDAPIHEGVRGLASDIPEISGRESKRATASEADRKAMMELARHLFQQGGLPETSARRIRVESLTRTVFLPQTDESFVGSFSIEEPPAGGDVRIHSLFLVANYEGGVLAPTLSVLKISPTVTENEMLTFVDQGDLFDVGQDNLIVERTFFENYRYQVYRMTRNGKQWEKIFETETLGCE